MAKSSARRGIEKSRTREDREEGPGDVVVPFQGFLKCLEIAPLIDACMWRIIIALAV